MPSPRPQPPERARLRALLEARQRQEDRTWQEIADAGGITYETIRRVRTGSAEISRDTREALEDGLRWERGSIRDILQGGDPTPLPGSPPNPTRVPRIAVEERVLNTSIGQVTQQIAQDLDADDTLTPEEHAELEVAIAERIRSDITLFVHAKRAEIQRRRRDDA